MTKTKSETAAVRLIKAITIFLVCGLLWHWLPGALLAGTDPAGSLPGSVMGQAGQSGPAITDIQIRVTGRNASRWEAVARDLLPLTVNHTCSLEKIKQAIAALVDSNLFSSIHVADPEPTDGGVRLTFSLVPFGRIKDIRVHNAFPLFKKEVINAMSVYVGDACNPADMPGQAQKIEALFKRQGYVDPKVTVDAREDTEDGHYSLDITIDKGPFLAVKTVRFQGNSQISASRLQWRTKVYRASVLPGAASRFIKKDLDKDVKKLRDFYREKGFADVRVDAAPRIDHETHGVEIDFNIDEGPWYDIAFTGNDHVSKRILRKELVLKKQGNRNNTGLKKSIRNLKKTYAEKGFPNAGISSESTLETAGTDTRRRVVVDIEEGIQNRVGILAVSGNRQVPEKEIRKSILTPGPDGAFDPTVLEKDIKAIRTLYRRKGFLGAEIEQRTEVQELLGKKGRPYKRADIRIAIREGVRTRVGKVSFPGLAALDPETVLASLALKPDAVFNPDLVEDDAKTVRQLVSEKGFPHVRTTVETRMAPDKTGVDVDYRVDQGRLVTVGQIFYSGNFRTREKVLADELEIEAGRPLSLSQLLQSRRNLRNLNALDSARFRTIGLESSAPEVDLVVEVAEKVPYFVEFGTGYDTERHFYANAAAGDGNFLGRNLDVATSAEISQIGYKTDISMADQRFLHFRTSSHSRLFAEEREEFNKDFGIRTYGVSQNFLHYFWDKKLTARLGGGYEFRDQYLTEYRVLTGDEAEQYRARHVGTVGVGLVYTTTDSQVRPRKGIFASGGLDLSKGIGDDLDDFIKYSLETRWYYSPAKRLTLAVRGWYGLLQPFGGNANIPDDQLFFLGGTSTVRGFDENMLRFDAAGDALGGREMILGSLELRYDLGFNLELSLFYDTGSLGSIQRWTGSDGFRDAVGAGLRYMTPIGPVGFLYGMKLDPEPNESSGEFHFSMGYTF